MLVNYLVIICSDHLKNNHSPLTGNSCEAVHPEDDGSVFLLSRSVQCFLTSTHQRLLQVSKPTVEDA